MGRTGIIIMAFVAGCASNSKPPVETAAQRAAKSVEGAEKAATVREPRAFQLRLNPTDQCECPPYEIFVYGGWQRVFVDGGEQKLTALNDNAGIETISVVLQRTGSRIAPNGVGYQVWDVR